MLKYHFIFNLIYVRLLFINLLNVKIMSELKDKLRGNWNQLKGKIKQEYADLTDNDLLYEEGKEDELIGRLQEKMGKTKEQVKEYVDKFYS